MYSCKLAVCAERMLVDERRALMSVVNVLDEISTQMLPIMIPSLEGVFLLQREVGDSPTPECALAISINGVPIFRTPLPCQFNDKMRNRLIFDIRGVPVTATGVLEFALEVNGTVLARFESLITQPTPPQAQLPLVHAATG